MPVGEDIGRSRRGGKKRGSGRGGGRGKGSKGNQDSCTTTSQEEGDGSHSGVYSKRKIENNWSRYKEPDAESSICERDDSGCKDFNLLLSQAGGASAHLKLKSEEEWLEDMNDVGELNEMESVAAKNRDDLILKNRCKTDEVKTAKSSPPDSIITESPDHISGNLLAKSKLESLESEITQLSLQQSERTTSESQERSSSFGEIADETTIDDDLDFLLSLGSASQNSVGKTAQKNTAENPRKMVAEPGAESKDRDDVSDGSCQPVESSSKSSNLDDWLDSILDD